MGYFVLAIFQLAITSIYICFCNFYTFNRFSPNIILLVGFIKQWHRWLTADYKLLMMCGFIAYLLELLFFFNLLGRVYRKGLNKNKFSHGTDHWASKGEMLKVGLFCKRKKVLKSDRILLAQSYDANLAEKNADSFVYNKEGKFLVSYDFEKTPNHLLIVSGTRGGKGTGTIISTLLTWKDSLLCFDPKGENYQKTAGYRSQFSKIIRIDPSNPDFSHINFLDMIRLDSRYLASDVRNLAGILLPTNPTDKNAYFSDNGRSLVALGILYVIFFEQDRTLGKVYKLLTKSAESIFMTMIEKFNSVSTSDLLLQKTIDKCIDDTNNFLSLIKTPQTLGGITTSATTALSIFADPSISLVTSDSHFDIADLMEGDFPVSIYVTVNVSDIKTTAPFTRALFSLINRNLMNSLKPRKRKLLMLIDEFSQLGRFQEIEETIPISAGYGICYILAIQSLSTLTSIYGKENAKVFTDNCITTLLKIQDPECCESFSKMLGTQTLVAKKATQSGKNSNITSSGFSISSSEQGRPLMTAGEIRSKKGDVVLVIIPSRPPYMGKRILYYEEKIFNGKENLPFDLNKEAVVINNDRWKELEAKIIKAEDPQTQEARFEEDLPSGFFEQSLKNFEENPELIESDDFEIESEDHGLSDMDTEEDIV